MSHVFLFLLRIHFFFGGPEVISGGEENDPQECEEEVVKSVSTFIILEIRFGHLESLLFYYSIMA